MANTKPKLTKELLRDAACRVNELMIERFEADPNATLEGYVPSEKHKKAVEEILANQKKKRPSKTVRTVLIVAAVLTILVACAMSVSAVRRAVYRFFFAFNADHAVVFVDTEEDVVDARALTEASRYREPSYIPEGFEEITRTELDTYLKVNYESDSNFITYRQEVLLDRAQVDTEKAFSTEIDVNGLVGYFSNVESGVIIVWYDDEYIYKISSSLDIDTVIKIAENVK